MTELTMGTGWGDAGNSWPTTAGSGSSADEYYGNGDNGPGGNGRGFPYYTEEGPDASDLGSPTSPTLTRAPANIVLIVEDHSDLRTSVMLAALNVRKYPCRSTPS